MIKLSNGHSFEYMSASGALGFDGNGWPWEQPLKLLGVFDPTLFTSVIKTLTIWPIKGHPLAVRLIPDGVVNAVGLANKGIEWWCKKIGPTINSQKIPLVGSIFGEPKELAEMTLMLNDFDLVGLEINVSCPNTNTDILQNTKKIIDSCQVVREKSRLPLILKVSVIHDAKLIVKELGNSVEAFSINSVPWEIVFSNTSSPLVSLDGGGVSGKVIQPYTWELVRKIVEITNVPVIGPSVWDFDDLEKVRNFGAKAISFGSIFLRYPWRPTLFVKKDKKLKRIRTAT